MQYNFSDRPPIAPIARWSVWKPSPVTGGAVSPPSVPFVDPIVRRRLSSLAKMVLHVAVECGCDDSDLRVVFASRHGELARTTSMLEDLATAQDLSPTLFSMSVLNAGVGLLSILKKITAPATAISAGGASFGYGLLEACLQLTDQPERPVLFIYADEPPPALYRVKEPPGSHSHAIGLLLNATAKTRITCSFKSTETLPSDEVQSMAFLRCLEQEYEEAEWCEAGRVWRWKRER